MNDISNEDLARLANGERIDFPSHSRRDIASDLLATRQDRDALRVENAMLKARCEEHQIAAQEAGNSCDGLRATLADVRTMLESLEADRDALRLAVAALTTERDDFAEHIAKTGARPDYGCCVCVPGVAPHPHGDFVCVWHRAKAALRTPPAAPPAPEPPWKGRAISAGWVASVRCPKRGRIGGQQCVLCEGHSGFCHPEVPVKPVVVCGCADMVNDALSPQGAELTLGFSLKTGAVWTYVTTERTEGSRRKLIPLRATYCPFCGKKYPEAALVPRKGAEVVSVDLKAIKRSRAAIAAEEKE